MRQAMNKEKVVYTLKEVKVLVDEARRRECERCAQAVDDYVISLAILCGWNRKPVKLMRLLRDVLSR